MPKIEYNGIKINCNTNENLRKVLIKNELSPYNGIAEFLNCRGLGSCGTCAVKVVGEVSPITKIEKLRLNFPPHKFSNGLRLACQCKVVGDLQVTKQLGFWGEKKL